MYWSIVAVSAGAVLYVAFRFSFFKATLRRVPYALIWGALVLLGSSFYAPIALYTCIKAGIFIAAFILIQAENDFYDKKLDSITQRQSLITFTDVSVVTFIKVIVVGIFIPYDSLFAATLAAYFVLGYLYNNHRFRLKKHFVSGTIVETLGAFLALVAGGASLYRIPSLSEVVTFCVIALIFGFLANVRDYKDFLGDKEGGIKTLYVVLEAKGVTAARIYQFFAGTVLVGISLSIFFLFIYLSPTFLDVMASGLLVTVSALSLIPSLSPRRATLIVVAVSTAYVLFIALRVMPYVALWFGY